jgi:hypothetical protein
MLTDGSQGKMLKDLKGAGCFKLFRKAGIGRQRD